MNSTDDFTDEQIESMNPQVLEQEIDKTVDEQYGAPQQNNQYGYEQNSQEGEQQQQEQYVDPQIYKDTYDRITAPFKAAGREFQVRSVDEAISLMQKGVDYTRKQQALKPRLMEMRALEEQGMLGGNLNYAIDLFKGNPQAIAKLIKEKNIDVNQIVPQSTTNEFGETVTQEQKPYVPNNYSVSPAQYELQEAFDNLKTAGTYDVTMGALGDMDQSSKTKFANNPKYIGALSELVTSGLYDTLKKELDHARIVDDPNVRGLDDFDALDKLGRAYVAYQQQAMQQQQRQPQQVQPQQQYPQSQQAPVYQQQRQLLDQRKQGVAPVRGTPGNARVPYDPLTCSDEEFSKINLNELLRM